MTEVEWMGCDDPTPMLDYLRGKDGGRKLRLFACGCCRRIWQMLIDERTQNALMVAEAVADGLASQQQRRAFYAEIRSRADDFAPDEAVAAAVHRLPFFAAVEASRLSAVACGAAADADWPGEDNIEVGHRERDQERSRQATLLRDLFGNPFRSVIVSSAWLGWNDRTVAKLAQGVYDDRAFDRLPIMGDALEEAGCDNADILDHCRQPGQHVRGCWAVDLLTGRK